MPTMKISLHTTLCSENIETKLSGVGKFFPFLKTAPGYIVRIFLPFLLLIVMQGINRICLLRRYKQKQQAEKEKRRANRTETQKMMAEGLAMKAQLAENKNGSNRPPFKNA